MINLQLTKELKLVFASLQRNERFKGLKAQA